MPATDQTAAELPARERIARVAHDLFYRDGIRATGIDRVIAEAAVTKVTFYRHFPSKSQLVLDFLERRHVAWLAWFVDALARHRPPAGPAVAALLPAMREWFEAPDFRGCAFINAVTEVGPTTPEVVELARRHKADMTAVLADLLPAGRSRRRDAAGVAVAVDGAIVRAQMDGDPGAALQALRSLLRPFMGIAP